MKFQNKNGSMSDLINGATFILVGIALVINGVKNAREYEK